MVHLSAISILLSSVLSSPIDSAVKSLATPDGDVYAIIRAFPAELLVPELLHAIDNDPEFAPGKPAREQIVLALARSRFVAADGARRIADRRQLDALLDALSWVSIGARIEIIDSALPAAAAQFPAEVKAALESLLDTPDGSTLRAALACAAQIGGLTEQAIPRLRALAMNPAEANPTAWASIADLDNVPSFVLAKNIRRAIQQSSVVLLLRASDNPDPELDWMLAVRGPDVNAVVGGMIGAMGWLDRPATSSKFPSLPLAVKKRWVAGAAMLMSLPEAAPTALGEGVHNIIAMLLDNYPDLRPELIELAEAVLSHPVNEAVRQGITDLID